MNDSDILARAAQALREAHTGERAASGFTRARIMNTLHRERRRRILRWAVFSPLVSVLLVGSAWAQSTGNWPVIWQAVSSVFSAAPEASEPSSRRPASQQREPGTRASSPVETPAPPEPAQLEPKTPEPIAEVAAPPAERAATSAPERPKRPSRAVRSRPRPLPEGTEQRPAAEPSAPAAARELASFRAAHDLHFRGDRPREAIAAYDAYLREYPRGRFVPEARYNSALDRIKLGERAAAREALAPFAAGEYGGYRRQEARDLLDALR